MMELSCRDSLRCMEATRAAVARSSVLPDKMLLVEFAAKTRFSECCDELPMMVPRPRVGEKRFATGMWGWKRVLASEGGETGRSAAAAATPNGESERELAPPEVRLLPAAASVLTGESAAASAGECRGL